MLNTTIKATYKGIINIPFDLVATFGSGAYCTAVAFNQSFISYGGDYINITYSYFQSVQSATGLNLISVTVTATFLYNYYSLSYDLTASSNYASVGSLGYTVINMMMANGVLLMQEQAGGLMIQYGKAIGIVPYYDPSIGINPILNFFIYGGTYYILFSGGLVSVILSLPNAQIISSSLVSSLPTASYRLIFNSVLDILYVFSTPIVYKSPCIGQSIYDVTVGKCVGYNCTVVGCKQCVLTANTCGICDTGYTWGEDLKCSGGNNTLNSITTNSTQASGSTATTNSTSMTSNSTPTTNTGGAS